MKVMDNKGFEPVMFCTAQAQCRRSIHLSTKLGFLYERVGPSLYRDCSNWFEPKGSVSYIYKTNFFKVLDWTENTNHYF